jgi:hypothetical protein
MIANPRDSARGRRLSIAGMMGLVVWIALLCKWPVLAILASPALAYRIARASSAAPGRLAPAAVVVILTSAVYLPCVIGFFGNCSHCREIWITLFPIVPGYLPSLLITFLIAHLIGVGHLSPSVAEAIASMTTVGWVAGLTFIGRRSTTALAACSLIALGYSVLAALVLNSLIRA